MIVYWVWYQNDRLMGSHATALLVDHVRYRLHFFNSTHALPQPEARGPNHTPDDPRVNAITNQMKRHAWLERHLDDGSVRTYETVIVDASTPIGHRPSGEMRVVSIQNHGPAPPAPTRAPDLVDWTELEPSGAPPTGRGGRWKGCCTTLTLLFAVMALRFGAYDPGMLARTWGRWVRLNDYRLGPAAGPAPETVPSTCSAAWACGTGRCSGPSTGGTGTTWPSSSGRRGRAPVRRTGRSSARMDARAEGVRRVSGRPGLRSVPSAARGRVGAVRAACTGPAEPAIPPTVNRPLQGVSRPPRVTPKHFFLPHSATLYVVTKQPICTPKIKKVIVPWCGQMGDNFGGVGHFFFAPRRVDKQTQNTALRSYSSDPASSLA